MPTLPPRAAELITRLQLAPHPEGGFYREIYRSEMRVDPTDGRPLRSALTVIHFLLTRGAFSRWHRVAADELWQYVEGDGLDLFVCDRDFRQVIRRRVAAAPIDDITRVVPAGDWQAARCPGEYCLVTCSVSPGFEFDDFDLLTDLPETAVRFRQLQPEWQEFV